MSGFLLLLVKVNLAMAAAIVLVSLIRRPFRAQFGAPIAYAIWLLVPIAAVASLLPPREVPAPAHVATVHVPAASISIMSDTAHSALRAVERFAGQSALMPPASMKSLVSMYGLLDTSRLLFAAWILGTLSMAAYLTRVQIRASAAVRRGQAGPAVLGFFFPRIVTSDDFQEQFTAQEQVAILAHESVHLARQDARINGLAAFLRCLCWFNPLIHLGARFLRIDQELACDAIAVSASVSRQTYAKALLKSQLMVGVLPFGCNWPGPQHPLVERIALLQGAPPCAARRLAGVSLVLLTVTSAGLAAWAAQPPVAADVPLSAFTTKLAQSLALPALASAAASAPIFPTLGKPRLKLAPAQTNGNGARAPGMDVASSDPATSAAGTQSNNTAGHKEWRWDGGDSVEIDIPATVHYVPQGETRVVVTGPRDLLQHIQMQQGRMAFDDGLPRTGNLGLDVSLGGVKLTHFTLNGSGQLLLGQLDQADVTTTINGGGDIQAQGRVDHLAVHISGSGHATLAALVAQSVLFETAGDGAIVANGKADSADVHISGPGNSDLGKLAVQDATVEISGSGTASIAPTNSAEIRVHGRGSATLLTQPKKLYKEIAGSGRILEAQNAGSANLQ